MDPIIPPPPAPARPRGDGAERTSRSRGRAVLWLALAASWVVLLPLLWSAVTTLPPPERLEQTRTAAIPTLRTLVQVVALSGGEVAFLLLLLWPRWRPAYTARLLAGALALGAWFVVTTPLGMTRLQWTHRRWLALVAFVLLLAGVLRVTRAIARRFSRGARPRAAD